MSKRHLATAAAIAIVAIAAGSLIGRLRAPSAATATATAVGKRATGVALAPASDAQRARFDAAMRNVVERLTAAKAGVAEKPVAVKRSQVVARVNGVAVTAQDLLPWRNNAGEEQTMSPAMLSFLLERAIDRELTKQAARAHGVELSAEQKQSLEQLRAGGRGAADPAQIEFQVRDTEGQFLLASLAEKSGVPSPIATTADIETYYKDHPGEFDDLPEDPAKHDAAWQKIQLDIRQTLATERQATYQKKVGELKAQLRAAAEISNG